MNSARSNVDISIADVLNYKVKNSCHTFSTQKSYGMLSIGLIMQVL